MHKLTKRVTTLPKNLSQGEKEIFDKISPFIISGLASVFCLDCPVEWKLTDTTQNDRYFSLFARTTNGEINLGEYSILDFGKILDLEKINTQKQFNDKFNAEFKRVNNAVKEMAKNKTN